MPKHVHAELMAQYAQDALETDKPWERWEFRFRRRPSNWRDFTNGPTWLPDIEYRRKPSRVQVAGEVFDDVVFDHASGPKEVFVVRPILHHVSAIPLSDAISEFLESGLVHTTYEGALRHLEALKPKKV